MLFNVKSNFPHIPFSKLFAASALSQLLTTWWPKYATRVPGRVKFDRPRRDGRFDILHAMVATIFIFGDRSVTGDRFDRK